MLNTYTKQFDGVNLYLQLSVKTKLIGKLVLFFFIIICFIAVAYLTVTSSKDENNNSEFIVPALIFSIIIIVFPVRYLIWNCYGKEYLILNTKTLSYYYSYHIINTTLKTKKINELSIGIEIIKEEDNIEYGILIFYNINEETNLSEFLFQTSVLLNYEDLQHIRNAIFDLFFEDEFKEIDKEEIFNKIYLN